MTFFEITLYREKKELIRRQVTAGERTAAIMAGRLCNLYGATDVTIEPISDPAKIAAMIARIAILSLCLVANGQGLFDDQFARPLRTATRITRTATRTATRTGRNGSYAT